MENSCGESLGGVKNIFFVQMPIDLNKIDYMSELNEDEAKEVKERGGIECIILSPSLLSKVQQLKELVNDCERNAEEYYQELDNEYMGFAELQKAEAYKEAIKIITDGKPILK